MSSESFFLRLPREIRDIIYRDYVTLEYGYVYNPATNKLKAGGPIYQPNLMALQSSCTMIAAEMKGLALNHNTVRFYTICCNETKSRANALFKLMKNMHSTEAELLHQARGRISPEAKQRMASRFPQLLYLIETFDDKPTGMFPVGEWSIVACQWEALRYCEESQYGEAPSVYRHFVTFGLQCIIDTSSPATFDKTWLSRASRVLSMCHEPWHIPKDENDIARRRQLLYRNFEAPRDTGFNYRFSAAAACIQFLRSVPDARTHMRQVVLEEDRPSVPFAECHALGLLPFLRENPKLHVSRRANLWRNIFQCIGSSDPDVACARHVSWPGSRISHTRVTQTIARWVVEHLDLPEQSFTLILDGDPAPEQCAEIFHESVSRDLQWANAGSEAVRRGLVPDLYTKDNGYRRFPQAMADIITGQTSLIRCNFNPGFLGDPEDIIKQMPSILERDPFLPVEGVGLTWQDEWDLARDNWFRDVNYKTFPPLPTWYDLAIENGNNIDIEFLRRDYSNESWDSQDWTLPFWRGTPEVINQE